MGTGTLLGPGFEKWDMALAKNTTLYKDVKMQLRIEAFDLFNHPNFSSVGTTCTAIGDTTVGGVTTYNPACNPASASFGQVTGDHEGRLLQAGAKFTF